MAPMAAVPMAIAAVTAACSLMSLIGAAFILICYAILPLDSHFRHVLILNLAISDFLNSLNNSIAGLYILAHGKGLDSGRACVFNGLVGQVTVQATDCAVLAIAISTVLAITRRGPIPTMSQGRWQRNQVIQVCCAIWALPFFTGFLALAMHWYEPVTGNWCWLKVKPIYLRYVLTHGWRFLFIFVEILLYVYLDFHLRRHYRTVAAAMPLENAPAMCVTLNEPGPQSILHFSAVGTSSMMGSINTEAGNKSDEKNNDRGIPNSSSLPLLSKMSQKTSILQQCPPSWSITCLRRRRQRGGGGGGAHHRSSDSFSADAQYQTIQRALLLNAYPLAYIILLLPGLANRLVEASGHRSKAMQLLQASTQLVGLANALTYGWNERVAKQLKKQFGRGEFARTNTNV